jgi:dTDP-4-dehydrorhamnose 3,5-epimerase
VISETAEVFYKCDEFYHKETEGGILWNDPALQIDWRVPADKAIISEKDEKNPTLANCTHGFVFKTA